MNANGLFLLLATPKSNSCGANIRNNPGKPPRNNKVQNKEYSFTTCRVRGQVLLDPATMPNFDDYLQTESERQA